MVRRHSLSCACARALLAAVQGRFRAQASAYTWRKLTLGSGGGLIDGLASHSDERDLLCARSDDGGSHHTQHDAAPGLRAWQSRAGLGRRAASSFGWRAAPCRLLQGQQLRLGAGPASGAVDARSRAYLACLRLVAVGHGSVSCLAYRRKSVTPAPLLDMWTHAWCLQRHAQKLRVVRELDPEIVCIGQSITQGWESAGREVWQRHYAKCRALKLGLGGDHTENLLWRLHPGEMDRIAPKVAVLMIDANDTGDRREGPHVAAAGIRRIVDEIRRRQPRTKLLVRAVFPRDEQPVGPLRRINERVNERVSALMAAHSASQSDDSGVRCLDINAALPIAGGTLLRERMPDLLQPGEKGYAIRQRAMDPPLKHWLAASTVGH